MDIAFMRGIHWAADEREARKRGEHPATYTATYTVTFTAHGAENADTVRAYAYQGLEDMAEYIPTLTVQERK